MNPLVPSIGDVIWAFAVIVNLAVVVAALVSLALSADKRRWLWLVLAIVLVPFAGPVFALVATRRQSAAHLNS